MANHKRGRPKNRRAGCLMCKPNKMNGFGHKESPMLGHTGFGNLRKSAAAKKDLEDARREDWSSITPRQRLIPSAGGRFLWDEEWAD